MFLGPIEIAGYFARLRLGFEHLGIRTMYVDLSDHPFEYAEAPAADAFAIIARTAARRSAHRLSLVRAYWKAAGLVARAALLVRAILTCDTFVFGAGHTLFGLRDLPLLRALGKRIVVVFFGSEVRPSYLDGIEASRPGVTIDELIVRTKGKRAWIRRLENQAHVIISHEPLSHLLSRPYVSWLAIGVPTVPAAGVRSDRSRLRILHAPSHPTAKGTDTIRAVVGDLADAGAPIEYRELSGQPNDIIKKSIADADIVIDQLYADTPMAVFASEAAAAGAVTVVGSLDWDGVLAGTPAREIPPTVRCTPESLGSVLRHLIASGPEREEIGNESRAFVRDRWSPDAVASRLLAAAGGRADPSWMRDPRDIRYVSGSGLTRAQLSRLLHEVASRGVDAFAVGDKPELEALVSAAAQHGPTDAAQAEAVPRSTNCGG